MQSHFNLKVFFVEDCCYECIIKSPRLCKNGMFYDPRNIIENTFTKLSIDIKSS